MRLAVMQPYLFPYLGYFQLAASVDRFVFLDDVAFDRRGWVNRNRLLLDGGVHPFTVPVRRAELGTTIDAIRLADDDYLGRKFLPTLRRAYGKAPWYATTAELVEKTLESAPSGLGALAKASVRAVCRALGLSTAFVDSSSHYGNQALAGAERILDICQREAATDYHNAPGGRTLYDPATFAARGVRLRFVDPELPAYAQPAPTFVPGLSILDALMQAGPDAVRQMALGGRLSDS
jgi:WbqC-like protein family